MAAESDDLRRTAAERVLRRFERQTTAMTEWQRQECDRDALLQSRTLENSMANQAELEAGKKQELAEQNKRWDQARDRLAPKPSPAPTFDMMGGPPARNLAQDHDEMRQRWSARHDQIVSDFDKRIGACASARAEMAQGFARANEARDRGHTEDLLDLAHHQQVSFDRLVKKEVDRADKWTSREFKRRTHDHNAREL